MTAVPKKEHRAPVIVVLGHVDHGKTTLLDYIKKTNVAAGESGGITQHIGAYEIDYKGNPVTFLDTPGHEAFSAMRSRGASVADIAILIVAADDGVKPQTKEAIDVLQKTKTPFVVAINKCDREGVFPEKTKRELANFGVLVESMGGDITSVNISAKNGTGVDELLDLILLMAEMNEYTADVNASVAGTIIESRLDKKRGATATLLVKEGILKVGDIIMTNTACGKVRILEDFKGDTMKQAKPSQSCVVIGYQGVPGVGEEFIQADTLEQAQREVNENLAEIRKKKNMALKPLEEGQTPLNIILKVDVAGSIEAIEKVLGELIHPEVIVRIIRADVGDITEGDLDFAQSANARIVGFRVKASPLIQRLAEDRKIKTMYFDIIYNLAQGVKVWQKQLVKPKTIRTEMGRLKSMVVFFTEGSRQIVGGRVLTGELTKGLQIEVERDGEIIGKGKNLSLQKNKKTIDKAVKRDEIAILFEGDAKVQEGDTLIFYGISTTKD